MSQAKTRFGIKRRYIWASIVAGIAALATLALVVTELRAPKRIPVEQRILEAERDALVGYISAVDSAPVAPAPRVDSAPAVDSTSRALDSKSPDRAVPATGSASTRVLPFADILVTIRGPIITELIDATLPIEREIGGRFLIRVDSARVTLRPGLALVEMSGRARLLASQDVFADIWLMGSLELGSALDEGSLAADISILGVQTRDVGLGPLSPPAEGLVDELARLRLSELDRVLGEIPIPVRLDEFVELPRVEEQEVTIPAARLAIGFRLDAVRVLEQGIFVSVGIDRHPGPGPATPDAAAPVAPVVKDAP